MSTSAVEPGRGTDRAIRTLADLAWVPARQFATQWSVGRCQPDGIATWSAELFRDKVRWLARGFASLGLRAGDRVAILSDSRPEWLVTDLAVLGSGAVTVPIYPTLPPHQVRHILNDSGARFVVAADRAQVDKVQQIRHLVPDVEVIIVFDAPSQTQAADGQPGPDATLPASSITLAALERRGEERLQAEPERVADGWDRLADVDPESLATIIYTSGTSGDPKGVMLSHRNILSNVWAVGKVLTIGPDDVALSFLPLSHSFERMVAYTYLAHGVSIVFAQSLDTLARDLQAARPTLMTGVPRVYEKLHARILESAAQAPATRRTLFAWAIGVGHARSAAVLAGRAPSPILAARYWLADRLVFGRIRARVGGRLRLIVSGSAPLAKSLGEFFYAVGIPIIEGYGLTETSPVLTTNAEHAPRFGTVGAPVPGVEIRIADDGEILARGPNIMMGYYGKPEDTESVLVDGWFHTGDIGVLDASGVLTITDRKKDLIVTSGGKNIAPQPLESQIKRSPLVAEALVLGDRRRYLIMLIVPNFDALRARLTALGRRVDPDEDLTSRPDVAGLYQELVDALNRDLAQFERIKRMALLPTTFSVATGELTPTLKVRRRIVEDRWKDVIERLYEPSA